MHTPITGLYIASGLQQCSVLVYTILGIHVSITTIRHKAYTIHLKYTPLFLELLFKKREHRVYISNVIAKTNLLLSFLLEQLLHNGSTSK